MFFRPSIVKVLQDTLYANERLLIDARAKAAHAKQLSRQADAAVSSLQNHIQETRLELAQAIALARGEPMSGMDPLHPANHGGL